MKKIVVNTERGYVSGYRIGSNGFEVIFSDSNFMPFLVDAHPVFLDNFNRVLNYLRSMKIDYFLINSKFVNCQKVEDIVK